MRGMDSATIGAMLMAAASWAYGQGGDPKSSLQQRLTEQFPLTVFNGDKSDIATPGAVLVLQKNSLMMYSTASPMPPANIYKNGKISQGMGGFGRDLAISMSTPGGGTSSSYPQRKFVKGEKFWVTGITIQKDGIVFVLYSDPYDDVRYYGQLKVPFEKGSVPSPDQAQAKIAEVMTVQPAGNSAANAAPSPVVPPAPVAPAAPIEPPAAAEPPAVIPPPPPPPPDTPPPAPKTITLGQTTEEVVALLGQPEKIVKLGPKQMYFYKDMKVTFVAGKVQDVQ